MYYITTLTDCSVIEALEAATLHPARALDIESEKGTLNFGAKADLVILDENLYVLSTWIAGNCVYEQIKENRGNNSTM